MANLQDQLADLLAQIAALSASNATLQGQVNLLQPGVQVPVATTFARTPAFRGQMHLLDYGKKADLSVYAEGKSPVFEGDERFDVRAETLGPFLKRLHKKVTEQGWNDASNTQQITLFCFGTVLPRPSAI